MTYDTAVDIQQKLIDLKNVKKEKYSKKILQQINLTKNKSSKKIFQKKILKNKMMHWSHLSTKGFRNECRQFESFSAIAQKRSLFHIIEANDYISHQFNLKQSNNAWD